MNLESIQDEVIIQEAVERLIDRVKKQTSHLMKFGSFVIQVHDGNCTNVEFSLKDRCFSFKDMAKRGVKNG